MRIGFRGKLFVLIFFAIGVCAVALILISAMNTRSALAQQMESQLLSQGQGIKENVAAHVERLRNYGAQVNDSRLIEGMFIAYEGAFYGAGLVPGKDQQGFTSSFEALNKVFYARTERMARDFSLDDIILVSTNAQVIFSLAKSKDDSVFLGKNLVNGAFKDLRVGECYRKARDAKNKEMVFSSIGVNPITKKRVAFLCQTKLAEFDHAADGVKKGDVLGVAISKINMEIISEIAAWKFGAGDTGVSYLIGGDQTLRTSYKSGKEILEAEKSILEDIKLKSAAISQAASGQEGIVQDQNPFDRKTMAFSSAVNFLGEKWILVVEKDSSEIFAPVGSMIWTLIGIGVVVCLLIGVVSFFGLNNWMVTLRNISEKMEVSSKIIADSSGQLKGSSDRMSKGASEGAASLEQTVASLAEVSSMVDTNSSNAQKAYQLSLENTEAAMKGSQKISQLIDSMRTVAERAERISEITVVIEDIAFQTNLLALNASVEAARAGEQGKGFAVVADAVRTLALKSSTSAKEISTLIHGTVEVANRGREEADQSGAVLASIVKSIQQTTEINQSIADASKEQAVGTREISTSMNSIDQVTQQNAALAASVQESSSELLNQAETLRTVFDNLSEFLQGNKSKSA
ncbi:MAG: methyl-accepting chemotaxis protein [Bdellovibrio sp.]|nr:methyl-accepting chemotaxis protein [Bdellovibrio sp.]